MLPTQTEPSLSGSGHRDAMVFRYPFKTIIRWGVPFSASFILWIILAWFLIDPSLEGMKMRAAKDATIVLTVGFVLGSFLLFAGALLVLPYLWSFRTDYEGITARRLLTQRQIAWKEMTRVERVIENTYDSGMAKIDIRGLRIVGSGTAIKVYDEVRNFELLRQIVNRECQARGTPMFEKDGSWDAA